MSLQGCAKQVGFEVNIGFDIEISRKYRYRIGIGYEIAREWISKSISFRNNQLTVIGFGFDFEILDVGILEYFRDNFQETLCSKISVSKSISFRNIGENWVILVSISISILKGVKAQFRFRYWIRNPASPVLISILVSK